jgi:hypothetical protein
MRTLGHNKVKAGVRVLSLDARLLNNPLARRISAFDDGSDRATMARVGVAAGSYTDEVVPPISELCDIPLKQLMSRWTLENWSDKETAPLRCCQSRWSSREAGCRRWDLGGKQRSDASRSG